MILDIGMFSFLVLSQYLSLFSESCTRLRNSELPHPPVLYLQVWSLRFSVWGEKRVKKNTDKKRDKTQHKKELRTGMKFPVNMVSQTHQVSHHRQKSEFCPPHHHMSSLRWLRYVLPLCISTILTHTVESTAKQALFTDITL